MFSAARKNLWAGEIREKNSRKKKILSLGGRSTGV